MIRQDCNSTRVTNIRRSSRKGSSTFAYRISTEARISEIMKELKGRSSPLLQKEFPHLKKRYWGQRFWATGFGAFSIGNITDEMVQKYIEGHRDKPNENNDDFFLE